LDHCVVQGSASEEVSKYASGSGDDVWTLCDFEELEYEQIASESWIPLRRNILLAIMLIVVSTFL
jgi:hypothetical protein